MSTEQHLLSGEREVARYGKFRLTDRRVLRHKGKRVLFLPIDRITTLSTVTTYVKAAVIIGGILVGVGIMSKLFAVMADGMMAGLAGSLEGLAEMSSQEATTTNYSEAVNPIFYGLIVTGIVVLGAGIASKSTWYQITAPGLTREDTSAWRLPRKNTPEIQNFIRMLEMRMAGGGAEKVPRAIPQAKKPEERKPGPAPRKLDRELLGYIAEQGGKVSVPDASKELGVPESEIKVALERLKRAGKLAEE